MPNLSGGSRRDPISLPTNGAATHCQNGRVKRKKLRISEGLPTPAPCFLFCARGVRVSSARAAGRMRSRAEVDRHSAANKVRQRRPECLAFPLTYQEHAIQHQKG
jgi:hypothetical protein